MTVTSRNELRTELVKDIEAGEEITVVVGTEGNRIRKEPLYEIKHNPIVHIENSPQAHVNIGSTDRSSNTLSYQSDAVFEEIKELLRKNVDDVSELTRLLKGVEAMEHGLEKGKGNFKEAYQNFITMAASHLTVLMPVMPYLASLL